MAESIFVTLKQELVYHCRLKAREAAKSAIFECIEVFYNRFRLHSTLNYQSPENVEQAALAAQNGVHEKGIRSFVNFATK